MDLVNRFLAFCDAGCLLIETDLNVQFNNVHIYIYYKLIYFYMILIYSQAVRVWASANENESP